MFRCSLCMILLGSAPRPEPIRSLSPNFPCRASKRSRSVRQGIASAGIGVALGVRDARPALAGSLRKVASQSRALAYLGLTASPHNSGESTTVIRVLAVSIPRRTIVVVIVMSLLNESANTARVCPGASVPPHASP